MAQAKKAVVSTFSLAMMTAAAVVSLRGLPMMAKEQLTLFVYIAFATFIFLIPAALVSAELGGAFGEKGGVYSYSQPELKRSYRVPGGTVGMWCIAGVGFASVAFAFLAGSFRQRNSRWGAPRSMSGWWWLAPWCSPGCRCSSAW